jgi:hypothetical protein
MPEKIIKVIDLVPGTVREVTTIDVGSLDENTFWNEFVCTHTPLLIKGGARHWPAFEHWKKPGYLESLCGDEGVGVSRTFNPMPPEIYLRTAMKWRKLSECLDEMRRSSDEETFSIPSMGIPGKWVKDLGDFSFFTQKFDRRARYYPGRRLFIYKNASTEWHYHPIDESLPRNWSDPNAFPFSD